MKKILFVLIILFVGHHISAQEFKGRSAEYNFNITKDPPKPPYLEMDEASIVFTDERALKLLNSILHPRIMQDFRNWASSQTHLPYVIQEAAIIFESGFKSDVVLVISRMQKLTFYHALFLCQTLLGQHVIYQPNHLR